MTEHIHRKYANGTEIDLYVKSPGTDWAKIIAFIAFIAIGLFAAAQSNVQPSVSIATRVSQVPWHFYAGIISALVIGAIMLLFGVILLVQHITNKKSQAQQEKRSYQLPKPAQHIEEAPAQQEEMQPAARVINMQRRAAS